MRLPASGRSFVFGGRIVNGGTVNLTHAVALHFMHYNFCRKLQTLGTTPAEAAGVAGHQWTIEELVGLMGSN